jgi:hypothetical protein
MIYRGVRDKWFAITSNHSIHKDATDWILSKKDCISKHLEEQKQYDNFDSENLQALDDIKTLTTELNDFFDFIQKNGGITSEASLRRLRELKQIPAFAKDPQFNVMCLELRLNGYDI